MTRALWWKELRAQAPLLVAASTIVLILPLFLLAGMLVTTPNYELAALGKTAPWTSGDGVELVSTSGYPIGWIDGRQLIVVNNPWREVDIEVVDIETNSRRKVYTRR